MLSWNVYVYNCNQDKIEVRNIFDHGCFRNELKNMARKNLTKEEFSERLKSELLYYFWSKTEYELLIKITEDNHLFLIPWCGCREPEKVKIDVTGETDFDWRSFADEHTKNKKQIYKNEAKIDIFDQIMFNWPVFLDYVYNNIKDVRE